MATPRKAGKQVKRAPALTAGGDLTASQALFVAEYLVDLNGKQAAIRAGYSPKTAEQQASRLLRQVKVKQAIAHVPEQVAAKSAKPVKPTEQVAPEQPASLLTAAAVARLPAATIATIGRLELSSERTRLEIARIAYFDPRKLFHADGRPKHLTELDDDTAACIAGMDVLEQKDGDGLVIGTIKKYKIADKNSALEKAAKILGEYEKDNTQRRPVVELTEDQIRDRLTRLLTPVPVPPGQTLQ